jgi:hypothetical protein
MTKDEALLMCLEYIEKNAHERKYVRHAIKHALETQRTWVGLTEDEIVLISADCAASHQHTDIHFAKAIEAKLKEKNG